MEGMDKQRHYSKAPITEALIDLRVELPVGTDVSQLEKIQEAIQADFPTKRNLTLSVGELLLGEQVSATARSKNNGFLFKSGDEKRILQVRLDGFTLSRLAPYQTWSLFRDEARQLWGLYRSVSKLVKTTRLALR